METLLNNFFANPLLYIGGFLSMCAAVAFIYFLKGFTGGAPHIINNSEGEEHLEHARTETMWGLGWLIVIFSVWEIIRFLWGQTTSTNAIIGAVLLFILWGTPRYLKWQSTPAKSHH